MGAGAGYITFSQESLDGGGLGAGAEPHGPRQENTWGKNFSLPRHFFENFEFITKRGQNRLQASRYRLLQSNRRVELQ